MGRMSAGNDTGNFARVNSFVPLSFRRASDALNFFTWKNCREFRCLVWCEQHMCLSLSGSAIFLVVLTRSHTKVWMPARLLFCRISAESKTMPQLIQVSLHSCRFVPYTTVFPQIFVSQNTWKLPNHTKIWQANTTLILRRIFWTCLPNQMTENMMQSHFWQQQCFQRATAVNYQWFSRNSWKNRHTHLGLGSINSYEANLYWRHSCWLKWKGANESFEEAAYSCFWTIFSSNVFFCKTEKIPFKGDLFGMCFEVCLLHSFFGIVWIKNASFGNG